MNKEEVRPLLFGLAEALRAKPFTELLDSAGKPTYKLVHTESGNEYEVEILISRNVEFEEDCGKDRLLEVELSAYVPSRRGKFWRRTACVSFDYYEKDGPENVGWVPHFP